MPQLVPAFFLRKSPTFLRKRKKVILEQKKNLRQETRFTTFFVLFFILSVKDFTTTDNFSLSKKKISTCVSRMKKKSQMLHFFATFQKKMISSQSSRLSQLESFFFADSRLPHPNPPPISLHSFFFKMGKATFTAFLKSESVSVATLHSLIFQSMPRFHGFWQLHRGTILFCMPN